MKALLRGVVWAAAIAALLSSETVLAASSTHLIKIGAAVTPPFTVKGDPIGSVTGLITRLFGAAQLPKFSLQVIPPDPATGLDVFEIASSGAQVVLRGNSGVAIATALNTYLKYTLNVSVSWGRNNSGIVGTFPAQLPIPASSRTVMTKWRYSWNVCTPGYSFVWYSFDQWQFMLDWMALQGVNMPLAFNGQEYVFSQVFKSLGLTDQEIWAYFSGPAFLPWNRMGNMQAWGALYSEINGLDDGWLVSQYNLQVKLVAAMRLYGMTPVLPGFAGHVPLGMERVFPNANYTHSPDWCGFNSTFGSVTLLEPTDPVYLTVGTAINRAILAAYGDPTGVEIPMFNADTFNEMEPASTDLGYLAKCNANMYASMVAADPRAIYVMQGWLFLETDFWTYDRAKAFLGAVPLGGMIILDLYSDGSPQWQRLDSYFNHSWIWNSLIVFGGRRGIYGSLPSLATSPYADRALSPSLIGIGVTPEAIDMSMPLFDVTFEAGWRSGPVDPATWLDAYAVRRYGGVSPSMSAAYAKLLPAAYNNIGIDESIIEDTPALNGGSHNTNASAFIEILHLFHAAFGGGELDPSTGPASYDITDFTRQVLCNLFEDVHSLFVSRFTAKAGVAELTAVASTMLGVIADIDTVDGADVNFLLGTWLADAQQWGFNASQTANRVFNARNQITLWGPNGEINDYAAKIGWSGLVSDYYLPRWTSFSNYLIACVANNTGPDLNAWAAQLLVWEQAWSLNTTLFPTEPSGASPLALSLAMLAKYSGNVEVDYEAHVGFEADAAPPPPVWNLIPGSTDKVAVSTDCPWVQKGDGSSVAACEASCAGNSACNAFNLNLGTQDCELRACNDPMHPVLSPGYPGWDVYGNSAAPGHAIMTAWHTNPEIDAFLCSATPACAGFSSDGVLSNAGTMKPSSGKTFYTKLGVKAVVVEGEATRTAVVAEDGSVAGAAPMRSPPPRPPTAMQRAKAKAAAAAAAAAAKKAAESRVLP